MKPYYETKADYVFDYLKDQIVTGKISQGESIVISDIANELNVSAIPVREAIKRLEAEGLVDFVPHKGATVTIFDADKTAEIIAIRAVLEGYACATAIPFITPDAIEELENLCEQMKQLQKDADEIGFSNTNKEFHRLIYKYCPYKMLYSMIFNFWDRGSWAKSIFSFFPEKMLDSINEHDEILKAIKERDAQRAEMLVREQHLTSIKYYGIISEQKQIPKD